MLRLSIAKLQPGMTVAKDVVNADGRLLIRKGVILTGHYIRRLLELGIGSVYIEAPCELTCSSPDVMADEIRMQAIQTVKCAFEKFKTTKKIKTAEFKSIAETIIDELFRNPEAVLHLTDIRTYDDYTFGHSVNVGVLAVLTGIGLGYTRPKLYELALGCLLHDLGKMAVPQEILNKPGKLSAEEMEIIKTHSDAGFEILRHSPNMPLLSAHVAYQHQERLNGTGYPRGLKGGAIHEYAQIAAVADVYDALTSDRPYRKGMQPHEAYKIMMASLDDFNNTIFQTFFEHVALYPIGTIVKLNTGLTAIVIDPRPQMPQRPNVRLLLDESGEKLSDNREIDLAKELTISIAEVYKEEQVLKVYKKYTGKELLERCPAEIFLHEAAGE